MKIILAKDLVPNKNFDWTESNLSPLIMMEVLRSNEENLESRQGGEDEDNQILEESKNPPRIKELKEVKLLKMECYVFKAKPAAHLFKQKKIDPPEIKR